MSILSVWTGDGYKETLNIKTQQALCNEGKYRQDIQSSRTAADNSTRIQI